MSFGIEMKRDNEKVLYDNRVRKGLFLVIIIMME